MFRVHVIVELHIHHVVIFSKWDTWVYIGLFLTVLLVHCNAIGDKAACKVIEIPCPRSWLLCVASGTWILAAWACHVLIGRRPRYILKM